jgi:hypothetical protein
VKLVQRLRLALSRGVARADTLVGVFALWYSGNRAADGSWLIAAITGICGLILIVASGDYCWRRGFVAGRREAGGGVSRPGGRRS